MICHSAVFLLGVRTLLRQVFGHGRLRTAALFALFASAALPVAAAPLRSEARAWQSTDNVVSANPNARRSIAPERYSAFVLDESALKASLSKTFPTAFRPNTEGVVIDLPMPDGTFRRFTVAEDPVMEPALAAKFPEMKTYSGRGVDDRSQTVVLDFTPHGFHAQVMDPWGFIYIDPYWENDSSVYMSYFRSDYSRDPRFGNFHCLGPKQIDSALKMSVHTPDAISPEVLPPSTGPQLRTYRLACAADGEYTTYQSSIRGHTPNVSDGLAAVVTAVNRVRGVYRTEIGISLILVALNDQLIFTDPATDPYTDQTNINTLITDNQTACDNKIGNANYDVGHVFTTGGGGAALLASACQTGAKAGGSTGLPEPIGDAFYIDFVAHELGHSFGGQHTFNSGKPGNCGPNRSANSAYEPGSGTTVQSYAGVCSDDIQPHSDPYFNAGSYEEIVAYTTTGQGSCPNPSNTGNQAPTVTAPAAGSYTIPIGTPFTLTATGSDPDGDSVTYSWEEHDLGPAQSLGDPDNGQSPIFRVFPPSTSPTRTFPQLSDLLGNVITPGEKLPAVGRAAMKFRVTARDGLGGVNAADTAIAVSAAAGPFVVTSPNTAVNWLSGSSRTVTWNVANTTAAPVSASQVNIRLSVDGGMTYPFLLAGPVANNGSANVVLPAGVETAQARIKVEAAGNIFFDVSNANFTISGAPVVTITNPVHQSVIASFTTIKGTAIDHSGAGIAGNSVNFTLYNVNSSQYWSGTGWVDNAVQFSVAINSSNNIWTYNGQLPDSANGTLRTGQYLISAFTHDNKGVNSAPQSGVNNIIFSVDTAPPTSAILSPANQSLISGPGYSFNGTANDDQGVNRVTLFIRRNSDTTYWNGSGWVADSAQANLSSTYNNGSHTWVCNASLPTPGANMPNGSYNFQALAIDNAGNGTFATSDVTVEFVVRWTGGTLHDQNPNNDSNRWDVAANWSTNSVPGSSDIVQLDNGDYVDLVTDRTVRGLRLSGSTTFGNHTLTVTGGAGTSVWSGGTISSNLVVAAGAAMTIDTTGFPYLNSGTITNAGTITVTNSDPLNPNYCNGHNSTLINQSGGRIEIARDGLVLRNNSTTPLIKNEPGSVFVKNTSASGRSVINWAMDNDGTVGSDSGTLAFDNGSSVAGGAGIYNASVAAARLEFAGGNHIFNTGARFTGPGRAKLTSGAMSMAGAVTIGTAGQAAGGFEQTGYGYLVGAGSLSMIGGGGTWLWSTGEISTTLNLGAGTVSTIDTTGIPYLNSGTIANAGTLTLTNSVPANPNYLNGHNSTLINQAGGRIEIARDGLVLRNNSTTPLIKNQAGSVFVKNTTASGRSVINWAMDNDGTVGSDSGTLAFDNGSSAAGGAGTFNASTATARVEFANGNHTFNTGARFTGPGRAKLTSGAMIMAGAVTIGTAGQAAGGFEQTGYGYLVGAGSLSMIGGGGTWIWSTGEISTALNLGAGTVSTIDTSGIPYLNSGTIANAGTITITNSDPANPQSLNGHNSTLINQSGGRIQIARDGQVLRNNSTTPLIKNQAGGVFVKTAAASGRSVINWAMDNDGTVQSDTGTLAFDNGSSPAGGAGAFNTATASARVEFANGNHTLNTGARFIGPGRGMLTSGAVIVVGAVTVGINGQSAGGFEQTGGYLVGDGSLSVIGGGGTWAWSSGQVSTTLNLGAGTVSTIDTTGTPYINSGALNNAGTLKITNSDMANPNYFSGHNSTLTNQSGGRIEIARDGQVLHNNSTTPLIRNQAGSVFVKTAVASGRSLINWAMDNDGTVGSDSGTLAFDNGSSAAGGAGVFNTSLATARVEFAGGNHTVNAGARFTGAGRGRLTNGTLIVSGAVTVGTSGQAAGGFEQSGGVMGGAGSLSVIGGSGTFAWDGGQISTALILGTGTTSTVDATQAPYLNSGSIDNSGTLTINSPASNTFLDGHNSNIYNQPGGRIELAGDGRMFRNVSTQPTLTNYGVIAKTAGVGTTDFGSFALIQRGTISLLPNTVLHLGDAVTFDFPSQIVGGKVLFDSASPTMKAPLTIGSGATLEMTAGGMNGAVDVDGNPLTTINGPGVFSWKAGIISGKLNLGPQLSWIIDNSTGTPYLNGATINHYGTAMIIGGGLFDGTSSSLNIRPGALFQVGAATNFRNVSVAPMIVNEGTFKIGGPAAVVTSSWNFTQLGTGKLDFEIGGNGAGSPPQFSRFLVNATALLGGKLSATSANGFVPAEGTTFPVMTFSDRNGTDFASTAGLNIATGVKLIENLTANTLNLNAVLTTFGDWRKNKFGADADNPLIAGPNADPDRDGIANALEFAFNLDPLSAGRGGLPSVGQMEDPVTHKRHLAMGYRRRIGAIDGSYTVRVSNNLTGVWDDSGNQIEQIGSATPTGDGVTEVVTVRVATPMSSAFKQFLEVMVHVD